MRGPAIGIGLGIAPGPRAMFDLAGGLPAGVSFGRASPGTRYDAAGTMVLAAADVPRFDHDPVTGALRGLLIEPARTNLIPWASAQGDASWSGGGVTVAADVAVAPDGTTTADRLTAGQANSYRYASLTLAAATVHTFSAHVRVADAPASLNLVVMANSGAAVAWGPAGFTTTGQWIRPAASGDTAALPGAFLTAFGIHDSFATGEALLVWGVQVEAGADATSFIPTAGAAATRAADVLTLDWGGRGVADGARTIRYTFDDGSTQDVATTVAGGVATVPTDLTRRWLRRAQAI